jgi:predicted transposase YbfD/YdcC
MESTVPTTLPATTMPRLFEAFAAVPDPRRAGSITYPLPAILALAVSALLCAHTSVLAIAEWGTRQPQDLLERLGFTTGQTPCQSTLQRLFAKLDAQALAMALGVTVDDPGPRTRGAEGVAIDGKAQRGRRQFDESEQAVHILSAFSQERNLVLAEEPITHEGDKAAAELTVAPRLIEQLDWKGRVLTGDALFCQRALCQQVLDAGGDYLLTVKANQGTLYHALRQVFDAEARPLLDRRSIRTIDQGHGRTAEVRQLIVTSDLLAVPDWPGLGQVFRIERTWQQKGKQHRQVRYGITSLPKEIGIPERLLQLRRRHWRIENRSHRAKDVNFGEDASLIHHGQGPAVCSVMRNAALNLLRQAGHTRIASAMRTYAQHAEAAVALVLSPPHA